MSERMPDKDVLIALLNNIDASIREFVKLLWENVKFFSVLLSSLITIDIYLFNFTFGSIRNTINSTSIVLIILTLIIPSLIFLIAQIGHEELRRRWARLIETLASRAKVEALLGFHQDLSDKFRELGIFPGDSYIFQRFTEQYRKFRTTDEFVKYEISRRSVMGDELRGKNFYLLISRVYVVFKIIAVALILIKIVILLSP